MYLFSKQIFLCQGSVWYNYAINDLRINKQKVDIVNNWTASDELLKVGKNKLFEKKNQPKLFSLDGLRRKRN